MEQSIVIQVPEEWLENIPKESLTLREIFRLGLTQYQVQRALALYRDDAGSLGYLAEQMGIPKPELIEAARRQGIEPDFSEETVREESGKPRT
ncbi:MAG: hypothetical protein ACP5JG_12830 [Anaerolineae bacterium]